MKTSLHNFRFVSFICASAVTLPLLALRGPAFAEENPQDGQESVHRTEFELPSFDAMLSAAMSHNPEVRAADSRVHVAQAESERVRLEVAQSIHEFRDEWNAELAALREAEAERRVAEQRLASMPEGAVAGRVVVQSEKLVETSKRRAMLAENRLQEMQQILPLLLGTAVDEDEAAGGNQDELNKILRERLDVLTQIAEAQQAAFQIGKAGFDAVSSAQADILEAKLELAQSGAERIEVLGELRDVARQLEQFALAQRHAGKGSVADALKATAFRLRCEADLLREQSSQ